MGIVKASVVHYNGPLSSSTVSNPIPTIDASQMVRLAFSIKVGVDWNVLRQAQKLNAQISQQPLGRVLVSEFNLFDVNLGSDNALGSLGTDGVSRMVSDRFLDLGDVTDASSIFFSVEPTISPIGQVQSGWIQLTVHSVKLT